MFRRVFPEYIDIRQKAIVTNSIGRLIEKTYLIRINKHTLFWNTELEFSQIREPYLDILFLKIEKDIRGIVSTKL